MNKRRFAPWTLAVMVGAVLITATGTAAGYLSDLTGHWVGPLATALEAKGIIAGNPQGQFMPDAPLTRAEFAKLIAVGLGNEKEANLLAKYSSRFGDISSWHWAKGYIESLAESGVASGYADGNFGPADLVTRGQMAVFLVRAADLADRARLLETSATTYVDDKQIPDWARGSIQMARQTELMTGFADGTFRPSEPITRAEGTAALARLLMLRGSAFHLTGTLLRFDPATLTGTVRDGAGQERSFAMSLDAQYYRNGSAVWSNGFKSLDQVWIVVGADGKGRFLDARYRDMTASNVAVANDSITVQAPGGKPRSFGVSAGALVFLNGRQVPLDQVNGAPEAYLALDVTNDQVRVLDTVNAPIRGTYVGYDAEKRVVVLESNTGPELLVHPIEPDAIVLLNSERVQLMALKPGDKARMALNSAGAVMYLEAER